MVRLSVQMSTLDTLRKAGLFDRNVPRYTSYPTAPYFHEGVNGKIFKSWVKALETGTKLSLYVHIPFCERLCWFCACRTQGVKSISPVEAYLDILEVEIGQLAKTLPTGMTISRIHWGGGSPTILPPRLIYALTEMLRNVAPFDPDIEFSIEIDPTSVDDDKLAAMAESGMNRASIGIQDFDPKVQATIGREQSFEVTQEVIGKLRNLNVRSINTDIVYGLPHQTQETFGETLDNVLALKPDRIALFGYAHVPWMAKRQKMIPDASLPQPPARFGLFNQARQTFRNAGYQSLGIDHFAKPDDSLAIAARNGRMRRNFQGYTDDTCTALIGLGASSISRFPNGYAQNRATTNTYAKEIKSGNWAVARGYSLSMEDKIRARAIEMLMCDLRIDLTALRAEFGERMSILLPDFDTLRHAYPEFVDFVDEVLTVNEDGFHLVRILASTLDMYQSSAAKHSMAI